MATVTWRSGNGSGVWSDQNNWFSLQTPGTADIVLLDGPGPYTATVDVPFAVGAVDVASAGVTLAIASTLAVATSVQVTTSAEVDLSGVFALGGTLDLSGGGTLVADGGTLEGIALLGAFSTIVGTGLVTNQGSIGWSSVDAGEIGVANASFDNTSQIVLAPIEQAETNEYVTSVTSGKVRPTPDYGELSWLQQVTANLTLTAASFVNSGTVAADGGTISIEGATFDNAGTIRAFGIVSGTVEAMGTTDGIVYYGTTDSTLMGQVTIGTGVTSYTNTGTIMAGSVEFQQAMTLGQVGSIEGGLTFDAGLDLGAGTLDQGTVSLGGLVQDGSIGGGGTLFLQAGATLDNLTIDPSEQVVEPSSGHVTIVDPPSNGAAITLDSVINELDFKTVSSFNGSIVLGPGGSNDVVGVFTPGGVTLGPAYSFTDSVADSLVTFGGPGTVLNDGTWSLDGASLEIAATLDGTGMINVANNAVVEIESLADGAAPGVTFGAGVSQVVLPGTGTIGAVLAGLQVGDSVDFAAVSSTPDTVGQFGTGAAATADGALDLTGASGDTASVAVASGAGSLTFNVVPDGNGGSIVEVACFVAGTRIATEHGEAPVERLRPGDRVRTRGGRLAPVRWVGWTRIDLARHPEPARAAPLCIRADAFAPGRPRRDLYVSPEHCLLVDGVLVPALMLANGATIARQDGWASVTYWHVELDRHDLLLAEGLPAESYLDTGNRALFAGETGVRTLHADFSGRPDAAALAVWAEHGCAPLRVTAPAQRTALRDRAEALGWRLGEDAGLAVTADGRPAPWTASAQGVAVRLPAGTRRVRLHSRSFVPAEQDAASGDMRRLGLAVAAVCLGGWKLHPEALRDGWHVPAGEAWRWTDGDAEIALPRLARPGVLELRLHRLGRYWQAPAPAFAGSVGAAHLRQLAMTRRRG